jgi:hypothetical protein
MRCKYNRALGYFYTVMGVGKQISLTLSFYVKSYKNKQIKPYDSNWIL